MNERLKELRRMLNLTQQEFADRLGIKRNSIASYETGKSNLGDAVVSLICEKLSVSEQWLRTGEGEAFIKKSRSQEIREYVDRIQNVNDNFKAQFAAALAALEEDDWKIILDVVNDIKEKSMAEKKASPETGPAPSAITDLTPEEQEIIRQHREKRKQAGASSESLSS